MARSFLSNCSVGREAYGQQKQRAFCAVALVACFLATPTAASADDPSSKPRFNSTEYTNAVERGIRYLETVGQAVDGSFSSFAGTGPTSLAITAMLRNGRTPRHPSVAKGLKYLESCVQSGGGIYGKGGMFGNYETCAAIMCFQEANTDGQYDELLKEAEAYVRGVQWDESHGRESWDSYHGGSGYGGTTRPDLSNTAFLVDALKARGADEDDEAIQRALTFVSRCQNLETEHNTTPFAAKINDGGFYYTPVVSEQDKERI